MSTKTISPIDYIHANIDCIHYNCTPYDVTFVESPSIRRTLMPKAWSDHRMADEKLAAYERHPQNFATVDRPSKSGAPNLPIRNASMDFKYISRSTVFIPIDGNARSRIGDAEYTFVLVEKWVAERIKSAREFLSPRIVVLYPEVMEIVPDFDRTTVTMNVFALGAVESPHDVCAVQNFATIKRNGCPFFFGSEASYDALTDKGDSIALRGLCVDPWRVPNRDNDDDSDKPIYVVTNQTKKRTLKHADNSEN